MKKKIKITQNVMAPDEHYFFTEGNGSVFSVDFSGPRVNIYCVDEIDPDKIKRIVASFHNPDVIEIFYEADT